MCSQSARGERRLAHRGDTFAMVTRGVSMRWWLALAFVLVASLTAVGVAELSTRRSEQAFRERALELAVGQSASAARAVELAVRRGDLEGATAVIAARRRASVFVVSPDGRLMTKSVSHGTAFGEVPEVQLAVTTALRGGRFIETYDDREVFVVALQVEAPGVGAVVTYTARPDLRAELGIIRNEIPRAALIAAVVGALGGALIAMSITARLRRIDAAAAAIERGDLDTPLRARFGDELGSVATTIDRMRQRLRRSFQQLEAERDRLRRLLEGLHEGVVAVDRTLSVTFANSAARRLLPRRGGRGGARAPHPLAAATPAAPAGGRLPP